jgi:hypothetical protein
VALPYTFLRPSRDNINYLGLPSILLTPLESFDLGHRFTTDDMDFLLGDFCLSCDRQTNGTNFCSSACRLTQLDQFTLAPLTATPSSSPRNSGYTTFLSSQKRPSLSINTGIFLAPAYDFSLHRTTSSNSISTISSRPTSPKLSEQAQNDLRDYAGSFDQTRTLKHRVSMQSNEDSKASWRTYQ